MKNTFILVVIAIVLQSCSSNHNRKAILNLPLGITTTEFLTKLDSLKNASAVSMVNSDGNLPIDLKGRQEIKPFIVTNIFNINNAYGRDLVGVVIPVKDPVFDLVIRYDVVLCLQSKISISNAGLFPSIELEMAYIIENQYKEKYGKNYAEEQYNNDLPHIQELNWYHFYSGNPMHSLKWQNGDIIIRIVEGENDSLTSFDKKRNIMWVGFQSQDLTKQPESSYGCKGVFIRYELSKDVLDKLKANAKNI